VYRPKDDADDDEDKLEAGSTSPTDVHSNHNGRAVQELPRPQYGVTTEPRRLTQPNHYQADNGDKNDANDNNANDDDDDDVQTRDDYINMNEKADKTPDNDDDDDDDDDDQTRGDYMNVRPNVDKIPGDYINVFEDGSLPRSTGTL